MLLTITLNWTGATLVARVHYGQAWVDLTNQPLGNVHRHGVALSGLDETTGVIVSDLVADAAWVVERRLRDAVVQAVAAASSRTLFDLHDLQLGPQADRCASKELADDQV